MNDSDELRVLAALHANQQALLRMLARVVIGTNGLSDALESLADSILESIRREAAGPQ